MKEVYSKKTTNAILFFIGLLLFSYTATRAYLLSFTGDESRTYLEFVHKGIFTLANYNVGSANNHLLNTWLMEISTKVFGTSDFTLRLPNLLAHLLFLIYSAKLLSNFSDRVLIICSFLVLNLNPSLLEYFSLARGYGISMGFMMVSLYFAYGFIAQNKSYVSSFLSVLFACVGLLANLSLLNYVLVIAVVFIFINLMRVLADKSVAMNLKGPVIQWNTVIVLLPLSILFFLIPIITALNKAGAFWFGGVKGFWNDTLYTLIADLIYQDQYIIPENSNLFLLITVIKVIAIIILLFSLVILFVNLKNDKPYWKNSFLLFISTISLLCFGANYFQHKWMNILFPIERIAFFYYPLFILTVSFAFKELWTKYPRISKRTFIGISFLFVANFCISANFHHTLHFKPEASAKGMINYLIQNKKKIQPERNNLVIGEEDAYNVVTDYYCSINHLRWFNRTTNENLFYPLNDYFLIKKKDVSLLPKIPYKVLEYFPQSDYLLVSNEQQWKPKEIYSRKIDFENQEHFDHLTNQIAFSGRYSSKTDSLSQFSDGFVYNIDDSLFQNKNSLVMFKAMIYSESLYPDAFVVVSFEHNSHCFSYQSVNLENCLDKAKEWMPLYFTVIVPKEILKGDIIKAYIWNISGQNVFFDDMEFKIVAYEK